MRKLSIKSQTRSFLLLTVLIATILSSTLLTNISQCGAWEWPKDINIETCVATTSRPAEGFSSPNIDDLKRIDGKYGVYTFYTGEKNTNFSLEIKLAQALEPHHWFSCNFTLRMKFCTGTDDIWGLVNTANRFLKITLGNNELPLLINAGHGYDNGIFDVKNDTEHYIVLNKPPNQKHITLGAVTFRGGVLDWINYPIGPIDFVDNRTIKIDAASNRDTKILIDGIGALETYNEDVLVLDSIPQLSYKGCNVSRNGEVFNITKLIHTYTGPLLIPGQKFRTIGLIIEAKGRNTDWEYYSFSPQLHATDISGKRIPDIIPNVNIMSDMYRFRLRYRTVDYQGLAANSLATSFEFFIDRTPSRVYLVNDTQEVSPTGKLNFAITSWNWHSTEKNTLRCEYFYGNGTQIYSSDNIVRYLDSSIDGANNSLEIDIPEAVVSVLPEGTITPIKIETLIFDEFDNYQSKSFNVFVNKLIPWFEVELYSEPGQKYLELPNGYVLANADQIFANVSDWYSRPDSLDETFEFIELSCVIQDYKKNFSLTEQYNQFQLFEPGLYTLNFRGENVFNNCYLSSMGLLIDNQAPDLSNLRIPLISRDPPTIKFEVSEVLIQNLTAKLSGYKNGQLVEFEQQIYFDNRTYFSEQINFEVDDVFWGEFDEGGINLEIICNDFLNLTTTISDNIVKNLSTPSTTLFVNNFQVIAGRNSYISTTFNLTLLSDREFSESPSNHKLFYLDNGGLKQPLLATITPIIDNLNRKLTLVCSENPLSEDYYRFVLEFTDKNLILFEIEFGVIVDKTSPSITVPENSLSRSVGLFEIVVTDNIALNSENIIEITIGNNSLNCQIQQSALYNLTELVGGLVGSDFIIEIRVLDRANNCRELLKPVYFDDVAPLINILPISNGTHLKKLRFNVVSDGKVLDCQILETGESARFSFVNSETVVEFLDITDGNYTLNITVVDAAYNEKSLLLNLVVDSVLPTIKKFGIIENQRVFGKISPVFQFEVFDKNLKLMSLAEKSIGYSMVVPLQNGTITVDFWSTLPSGTYNFCLIAEDFAGNFVEKNVVVIKDIDIPIIKIHTPVDYSTYSSTPSYRFTVTDDSAISTVKITINNESKIIEITESGEYSGEFFDFPFIYTIRFTVEVWDIAGNYANATVVIYQPDAPEEIRENTLDLKNLFTNMPLPVKILCVTTFGVTFLLTIRKKPKKSEIAYLVREEF